MTDERLNLPSASGFDRLMRCPGSWLKCQSLPDALKDTSTPDADEGTRRHDAISEGKTFDDDRNADYVIQSAHHLRDRAITSVFGALEGLTEIKEERFWVTDDAFDPMFSGKVDHAVYDESTHRLLIIDYKALWGDHGTAWANEQLACYAALIAANVMVSEAFIALIQPNLAEDQRLTIAHMSADDIKAQHRKITAVVNASKSSEAKTFAGKQCIYCPAFGTCETAKARANVISDQLSTGLITGDDIDDAGWMEKQAKAVKESAKKLLIDDPKAIPGWEIGKGRITASITDETKALEIAAEAGPECIKDILTVSLPKFKTAWWHHLKKTDAKIKRRDAEDDLKERLADAITEKQGEGMLQKIKTN